MVEKTKLVEQRVKAWCSCGRNLNYPLSEDDKEITCRCGKKHKKGG